nr:hypothetical protein [uncultured Desulfobacter sp.]
MKITPDFPATPGETDNVEKVVVRVAGKDRIRSPVENTWDSFFFLKMTFLVIL